MSAGGAFGAPHETGGSWAIVIAPLLKEHREPKMVPCAICGKSIPLSRAVKQDNKLICQDCHNKLHTSKQASKETAQ